MRMLFEKTARVCFALVFFLVMPHPAVAQDAPPDQATSTASSSAVTTLPPDIDPNSPLGQIVNLAQSGVSESVLTSYAGNSATPFNLTADQIIYLKDIGVPDSVVQAMIARDQQLGATDNTQPAPDATADTAPPGGDVTDDYFYGALAPYGGWVNVSGYGLCWRPTVVVYNSGWQPYCDHGHWVYTDDGWFWMSDYSWGWATFHYGRWFHDARWGWCWWPDTDWAPSWVCWRYSDSYCGWAPLPPHSSYRPGVGFVYNGITVGAGFDFGISAGFFTFVPTANFCDPHPGHYRVDAAHLSAVYHQTTVVNNFDVHSGVFVNHGIDPGRISAVTRTPIHPVSIRESGSPVMRGEVMGGGQTLVINRPHFTGAVINTMHQGQPPREVPQQFVSHPWYTTPVRQNDYQRPQQNQPNRPPENYQSPQSSPTKPNQTGTAPQHTYQAAPVETPQRTPSMNEPVQRNMPETPAEPQTHYQENEEPKPEYNNSPADHYTPPRLQQQSPQTQPSHETAPAPSRPTQPQQSQPQQGQKNKYGNGD